MEVIGLGGANLSEMDLFETSWEAVLFQWNDPLVPQGAVLMAPDWSPGPYLELCGA